MTASIGLLRCLTAFHALLSLLAMSQIAAQNSNGGPGEWEPPVSHGTHPVGCPGATEQFRPVHAAVIPRGTHRGWVLLWENGHHPMCGTPTTPPSSLDAHWDQRWALLNPHTNPPTILKFAWQIMKEYTPRPPCTVAGVINPTFHGEGNQGLFCSGHCWLPNGKLLVAGGDYALPVQCWPGIGNPVPDFAGTRMIALFDPDQINTGSPYQQANGSQPTGSYAGGPWTSLSEPQGANFSLRTARWYPSVTPMSPVTLPPTNGIVYISIAGGVESIVTPPGAPLPTTSTSLDPSFSTHELLTFDLTTGVLAHNIVPGTVNNPFLQPPGPQPGFYRGPTVPHGFLYYPRLHYMSAQQQPGVGRLFMAGMAPQIAKADAIYAPEAWTIVATSPLPLGPGNTLIDEPCAVRFPTIDPGYRDVQMLMGGMRTNALHAGGSGAVSNEIWFVDAKAATPSWVPGPSMIHARKYHNAVLLPDSSIVVIGGGTNTQHGGFGGEQLEAEMFADGAWTLLADQFSPRTYHSVAVLLDNGCILSAGGDTCIGGSEYEIFIPPYLQHNPARPTIGTGVPTHHTIQYGQDYSFKASAPFGQSIERVVLISPGSVTHGQDPNQRWEPLAFERWSAGVTVAAPTDASEVPPGYYMMFAVSSAGVPSVAHWVQLLP